MSCYWRFYLIELEDCCACLPVFQGCLYVYLYFLCRCCLRRVWIPRWISTHLGVWLWSWLMVEDNTRMRYISMENYTIYHKIFAASSTHRPLWKNFHGTLILSLKFMFEQRHLELSYKKFCRHVKSTKSTKLFSTSKLSWYTVFSWVPIPVQS